MAHLGILCPAATGHLNPMCALGRELLGRGHRVTLFQIPDFEPKALAAGLEFVPVGGDEYPPGRMAREHELLGELRGRAALRFTIGMMGRAAAMTLRAVPDALRSAGVEALLVDQVTPSCATVADHVGLPYVSVANALLFNAEPNIPPGFTSWDYRPDRWGRLRNRAGYALFARITRKVHDLVNERRRGWGLPEYRSMEDSYSTLAQVSQQPRDFDFPRESCPANLHYCGPFLDREARSPVDFPYEKLDGRPLIYASLGTLQNRRLGVFRTIAEACRGLDPQLVISLGGSATPGTIGDLPGSPIVVGYAPQLEMLGRACLTITHAGLNTVLESLAHAVPMVALPVANDQPAVGARLKWSGAGEVVPPARFGVGRLRAAVERVLSEPGYALHAERLRCAIRRSGGASHAADVIERAIATGRPVLA